LRTMGDKRSEMGFVVFSLVMNNFHATNYKQCQYINRIN
jgi:hypothetical protein